MRVFDPVFNSADVAILQLCGCSVMTEVEASQLRVTEPTLLYMPHCETEMYNNLLDDNWSQPSLGNIVIVGNSFAAIAVR